MTTEQFSDENIEKLYDRSDNSYITDEDTNLFL